MVIKRKEVHAEPSHVSKKSKTEKPVVNAEAWRKEHGITIIASGNNYVTPPPMLTFDSAPFPTSVLIASGFEKPTPTQSQSWPIALSQRDLISVAKTGSGKTIGFLLPSFHQITRTQGAANPQILVLAPTRELATQIQDEAQKFGKSLKVRSTCVYGGAPKSIQIRALKAGVDCLIATPGRLNDLLNMGCVNLKQVKIVVLDEADRMLDMGFEPQIRSIIEHISTKRQTLLFSATWPKSIQRLATEFLSKPIQVNMGELGVLHANPDIQQNVSIVQEADKPAELQKLLKKIMTVGKDAETELDVSEHPKTIIFFRTKRVCDRLANQYWDMGYCVDALHGDKEQWQRTKTVNDFKAGTTRILFATDVAARGLDVENVQCVINYDMSDGRNGIEDYVHRIGRTGRAGKKGTSFTFITHSDAGSVPKLIEILKHAKQEIPAELQALRNQGGGKSKRGYGGGGKFRGGNGKRW